MRAKAPRVIVKAAQAARVAHGVLLKLLKALVVQKAQVVQKALALAQVTQVVQKAQVALAAKGTKPKSKKGFRRNPEAFFFGEDGLINP